MSEWGLVAFHYDYLEEVTDFEKEVLHESEKRKAGLVIKSYKYPGIPGVVLHGFNAMRYFLEHNSDYDFDRNILNTAMDIFFEYRDIEPGVDNVELVLKSMTSTDDLSPCKHLLNCEGTHGFMYFDYSGDSQNGYKLKYMTEVHGEHLDVRSFAEKSAKGIETGITTENVKEYLFECVDAIEENATQMTEEEIEEFDQKCVDWILDTFSLKE